MSTIAATLGDRRITDPRKQFIKIVSACLPRTRPACDSALRHAESTCLLPSESLTLDPVSHAAVPRDSSPIMEVAVGQRLCQ
jgi:hypothetical protein